MTAASQNVEECLKSETARLMFANSEFLLLFNQAATDRAELSKLLHISDTQLSYIKMCIRDSPNPLLSYIVKIVRNISLKTYWRKEAAKRSGHYTVALEEIRL